MSSAELILKYGKIRTESRLYRPPSSRHLTFPACCQISLVTLSEKFKSPCVETVGLPMKWNVHPRARDAGNVIIDTTGKKYAEIDRHRTKTASHHLKTGNHKTNQIKSRIHVVQESNSDLMSYYLSPFRLTASMFSQQEMKSLQKFKANFLTGPSNKGMAPMNY